MTARRERRRRFPGGNASGEIGSLRRALKIHREEARLSTERWLDSEERVDAAKARLRSLWEESTIGYLRLDLSGTIVEINRVARALLGATRARLVGTPLVALADHSHAQALVQHMMRCRSNDPVVVTTMKTRVTARVIELISTRVGQGNMVEFNTFVSDLSARHAADEAVRESEQRYRRIVEHATEGICSVDENDRITFVNRRFARMLGGEPGDFVSLELTSLVHPDDRELARTAFRWRDFGVAAELRLCRRDRSMLWTSVSSAAFSDGADGPGGVFRMFTDISDRKELEAMRARLVKYMVAAQEAERRRISRELHDQTGQHVVGLTLNLDALAKIAPPTPEVHQLVERLQKIAAALSRDVHHLAVELRPAALDDLGLGEAVGNYADAISEQYGIRVDLHCAVAQRLDPAIETTVYRVVQEALTNVVRHASARQVSVIIESHPTQVRAVIEDDGVGFAVTGESQAREAGLGLIGMRERAALVGGELTIESSESGGTTLFLRVPLTPERKADHEETAGTTG